MPLTPEQIAKIRQKEAETSEDALKLLNFYTNYRKAIITPGTELYRLKQEYDENPTIQLRRKK